MRSRKDRILIWHCIRHRSSFRCAEIAEALGLDDSTVRDFAKHLLSSGLLNCDKAVNGSRFRDLYILVEDANRIKALPEFFEALNIDRVWRSVRVLKNFTSEKITSITGVSLNFVQKCLRQWAGFGLLSCEPNQSGVKGSFLRYRLINDLGVGTPIIVGDLLLDSNSGKFLESKNEP